MTQHVRVRLAGVAALCGLMVTPADAVFGAGQIAGPIDSFRPIAFLIGRWEGRSDGQPGVGSVRREYDHVLNTRYVRAQNTSTYAPQPKNPKGEVHQDVGFFSFDTVRKRLILRQFHGEGFVNQYVQEPDSESGRLVFTSEAIENIPPGWRARETYVVLGPDEFEEIFELAPPDKGFELYSRARFTRVRY
jgi:hypothetical protein